MSAPARLPIRWFRRLDFYGVLFVHFPTEWTWHKARDALDRLLRRVGETEANPATVLTALSAEAWRVRENLPREVIRRMADEALEERKARNARRLALRGEAEAAETDEGWGF